MKTVLAFTSLLTLAVADWSYTFTGPSGAWTSVCTGEPTTAASNHTTAASAKTGEWTFSTHYTATYSSGSSTWGVPQAVSYSAAANWTSMIPAPKTTSSTASGSHSSGPSSVAATTTAHAASGSSSTSASVSVASGNAASSNKMFGGAAFAAGALALML